MSLLLFGFKASGKTHFGKILSKKMHRPLVDTDDLIKNEYEKEYGFHKSIRQIYKEHGAEEFRKIEKKVIQRLKIFENTIIALGGGTVLNIKVVNLLQEIGAIVYLKTSPEKLKERIFKDELPAFLDPKDPEGSFYEMIHEREPIYRSIEARVIDTDQLDKAGVISALHSILLLKEPPNGF